MRDSAGCFFLPVALMPASPNGTQKNLVLRVAHCGSESRGQLEIAGHEPEEFAGIQQNPHLPSNVCNTSSGSGALKSSGTVNWPFAKPMGRGWESGGGFRFGGRSGVIFPRAVYWLNR
jgi:hypothetical protein